MLSVCHSRVERQCATLRRLVVHLAAHGADQRARMAATNVMRYFDTSAKHHHADEEEDLSPALMESMAGSDAVCLGEIIEGLKADHRALEAAWRHLRGALERIAAGESPPLAPDDVEALVGLYERHIRREESELLPMAARLLSEDDLARVGRAMRERRGILHFHCVVIDGVFDSATTGGVIFSAATGLDANAIAQVQGCVRRRLLRTFVRRGLLPGDDARVMAQWQHGGGFSVGASVRIEAADRGGGERLLRYCARPPFALDRLRELDPERLLYVAVTPGPGRSKTVKRQRKRFQLELEISGGGPELGLEP
jgi:hemerythrin-like domain-containing protein